MKWTTLLVACAGLMAGCGAEGAGKGTPNDTATACDESNEACTPDICGGEGSTMLPGSDCVACHSPGNLGNEEEASKYYGIAGTIFEDIDGSSGASGVTIRVTDANGDVTELSSNSAGNFYTTATPVYPIATEVERDGAIKQMVTPVTTAACNTCHACAGQSGGKLYAP